VSAPAPAGSDAAALALDRMTAAMAAAGGALAELAAGVDRDALAPLEAGTSEGRAQALTCAWAGSQLHAGLQQPLPCPDSELALLAGDWLYARALELLALDADLTAIDLLATAISSCAASAFEPEIAVLGAPAKAWQNAARGLLTGV
jgi:hypothetical protein